MRFVLFHDFFPDLAERETRTVTILRKTRGGLPPGEYALCEMFCDEPGCDCRRVMFYVVEPSRKGPLAVVNFGWESSKFYERWLGMRDLDMLRDLKGPSLNLGSPRSELAPAILRTIRDLVLPDGSYIERVKQHYRMFRERIDGGEETGKSGIVHRGGSEDSARSPTGTGKNSPCPCGSGKKYKRCCGKNPPGTNITLEQMGPAHHATPGKGKEKAKTKTLHQFKITLEDIHLPIWRRIQVPSDYTFWDLHVAIQDAMGWCDSHLHAFRVPDPEMGEMEEIGIPDEEGWSEIPCLAGWDVPISDYFIGPGSRAEYEYDFGDGWLHEVVLEEIVPRPPRKRYPKCLAGARACPPEDCGGIGGYEDLLEVLSDPAHEDHEEMKEWLGRRFDPDAFNPAKVRFDDPEDRLDFVLG